jgi:uncharacterized membrane protein
MVMTVMVAISPRSAFFSTVKLSLLPQAVLLLGAPTCLVQAIPSTCPPPLPNQCQLIFLLSIGELALTWRVLCEVSSEPCTFSS